MQKIIVMSLTFGLIFLSGISVAINPISAFAQTSSSVQDIQKQEFKGEVLKIDGEKVTVDSNGTTKEFTVPSNIRITRNTLESKLSDLKVKDSVTVSYTNNNQVLALDSTAGSVFDISKFIIPAIILALLLVGLIYFLSKRSKQGQIKTSTGTKVTGI